MIGTGVFTSVGFQLAAVQNTWSILLLWIFGGIMALFGAFAYAELGTHFKESGGDYIYLSRVFYPVVGYLSAWAGLTVGFSAPVALAAMAFEHEAGDVGEVGTRRILLLELDEAAAPAAVTQALPLLGRHVFERRRLPERRGVGMQRIGHWDKIAKAPALEHRQCGRGAGVHHTHRCDAGRSRRNG